MTRHDTLFSPEILGSGEMYDIFHFCQICKVETPVVVALVEEGVVEPVGQSVDEWRFSYTSVLKVQKATRLQRDFDLNLAGVALSIDLLDEIEELRNEIKRLRGELGT